MSAVFTPTPMRISIDRYQRMVAAGVLTRADRVELIEGEILNVAPTGERHADVVVPAIPSARTRFRPRG